MAGTRGARQVAENPVRIAVHLLQGPCSSVFLTWRWHRIPERTGCAFQFRKPRESPQGVAVPPEAARWALWPGSLSCAGSRGAWLCRRSLH